MKILVAGDWHSELHEEAVYQALIHLGQDIVRFPWQHYFKSTNNCLGRLTSPALKFQNKYLLGPVVHRLNRDLVACVSDEKPDAVFIYRGSHIYPETLHRLRETSPASVLIGYNNDDPFSPACPRWMWRHFLKGIREYDLVLAYRCHNLEDFTKAGARRVNLLRSWYIPERNRPVELNADEQRRFGCDVVFVGHYENDGRLDYLKKVVHLGYRLRLWGPGYEWEPVLKGIPELREQIPVRLVWGDEYNKALVGAKIALNFLSKLNRDTYTRRCFEIPATGTFLFSEYSEDLSTLFAEGIEAEFFRSLVDFEQKLRHYLVENEAAREQVAKAGLLRVSRDGHDVESRMCNLLGWIEEVRSVAASEKCVR